MIKNIKCKLTACRNNESKKCTIIVPTMIPQLSPNKTDCEFYEDDEMFRKLRTQHKSGLYRLKLDEKEKRKLKRQRKKKKGL